MMMRYVILLLFCLCAAAGSSQREQKHYLRFAEEAMAVGDYHGAARYFKQVLSSDSKDIHLQYAYAEALRLSANYADAQEWYVRVNRKDRGRYYPDGPYWIAQMMEANGEYEDALDYWRKVLRTEDKESEKGRRATQRIKSCRWAMDQKDKSDTTMVVENVGEVINSPESEFGAVMRQDSSIVFGSLRGAYSEMEVLKDSATYQIRLFRTDLKENSTLALDSTINRPMVYVANADYTENEGEIYFSICEPDGACAIYSAKVMGEDHGPATKLEQTINAPATSSTQPQILEVEGVTWLLFASDRPGGEGGMDIYLSEHGPDGWGTARNLGRSINSPGNEISPHYVKESSKLYFSSDWHEGFGLMDIFRAEGSLKGGFRSTENIGRPYNSSVNDMYYSTYGTDIGFLTSNRIGSYSLKGETCCNDIYRFRKKTVSDLVDAEELADEETNEADPLSFSDLPETIGSVSDLTEYLPIALYFHNDRPGPKSVATTTSLSYGETMENYLMLRSDYEESANELDKGEDIAAFFDMAEQQYRRLDQVSELVLKELSGGKRIGLAIKGYASPLAQSDYNLFLTQRRIESLVNHFRRWQDGALLPYIIEGSLSFERIPFGESRSEGSVSDAYSDQKASVYSAGAAKERRIEILRIEEK